MKQLRLLVSICLVLFLSACKEKSDNIPAFANPNAPEYRALTFFDAIYNQKSIKLAQKYSTEKHSRIVASYGSTKGYARYVLNMQFDPGVDLKIDRTLNQIKIGDPNKTSVNILFTGKYRGNMVNDLRKVIFTRVEGEWLISEIGDDPYAKRN
mgnify:FL=1